MTPPKRTVTGFVAAIDGAGHTARQLGPELETEDEVRAWLKRAMKTDPALKTEKIVITKATVTLELIGPPA